MIFLEKKQTICYKKEFWKKFKNIHLFKFSFHFLFIYSSTFYPFIVNLNIFVVLRDQPLFSEGKDLISSWQSPQA